MLPIGEISLFIFFKAAGLGLGKLQQLPPHSPSQGGSLTGTLILILFSLPFYLVENAQLLLGCLTVRKTMICISWLRVDASLGQH